MAKIKPVVIKGLPFETIKRKCKTIGELKEFTMKVKKRNM